jgi:hypothetical protein
MLCLSSSVVLKFHTIPLDPPLGSCKHTTLLPFDRDILIIAHSYYRTVGPLRDPSVRQVSVFARAA